MWARTPTFRVGTVGRGKYQACPLRSQIPLAHTLPGAPRERGRGTAGRRSQDRGARRPGSPATPHADESFPSRSPPARSPALRLRPQAVCHSPFLGSTCDPGPPLQNKRLPAECVQKICILFSFLIERDPSRTDRERGAQVAGLGPCRMGSRPLMARAGQEDAAIQSRGGGSADPEHGPPPKPRVFLLRPGRVVEEERPCPVR